jgi:Lrp/AsnC family leucine-responsive transcriptional regulator
VYHENIVSFVLVLKEHGAEMDRKNIKILKILQEKARIPNVEVSRLINLAPSAVLERIRKMEQQGIIDRYEVRLNPARFNCRQISFIHIYLLDHAESDDVGATLSMIDEIQEIHFIAGADCFLVKVRTAGTTELDTLLRTKIMPIPGVRTTRTFPVLSTIKETAQIPIKTD